MKELPCFNGNRWADSASRWVQHNKVRGDASVFERIRATELWRVCQSTTMSLWKRTFWAAHCWQPMLALNVTAVLAACIVHFCIRLFTMKSTRVVLNSYAAIQCVGIAITERSCWYLKRDNFEWLPTHSSVFSQTRQLSVPVGSQLNSAGRQFSLP